MVPKNKAFSNLLITFVYFLLVSIARWRFDLSLIWLWLGAFLGTFLLDFDHLIYWFITHPEEEDSKEAEGILSDKMRTTKGFERIKAMIRDLYELLQRVRHTHSRLIFHSIVGQAILFILAIFVLSSGGSVFGSSLIMAANLHLLKDEWIDFEKNKEYLADYLFWQIREPKLREYLKEYLITATLIFLILTGLLIKGV